MTSCTCTMGMVPPPTGSGGNVRRLASGGAARPVGRRGTRLIGFLKCDRNLGAKMYEKQPKNEMNNPHFERQSNYTSEREDYFLPTQGIFGPGVALTADTCKDSTRM